MKWYKIYIKRSQISKGKHQEIIRIFKDISLRYSQEMRDVALFSSNDLDSYFLYFTPFSMSVSPIKDLIDAYEAEPCYAPVKGSVTLISGDLDSLKLLKK